MSAKWVAHVRTHVKCYTESMPDKRVAHGCTLVRYFFFPLDKLGLMTIRLSAYQKGKKRIKEKGKLA